MGLRTYEKTSQNQIKRKSVKKLLLCTGCLVLMTATILPTLFYKVWHLEILSNLKLHFLIIAFIFIVFGNLFDIAFLQLFSTLIILSFIIHFSIIFLPNYYNKSNNKNLLNTPKYSVTAMNVLFNNERKSDVIEQIKNKKSDFFVLSEVNLEWFEYIQDELKDYYPTIIRSYGSGRSDVVIISQHPYSGYEPIQFRGNHSGMKAYFKINEHKFTLYGIHPYSPMTKRYWILRNDFYETLTKDLKSETNPSIIAGDLNNTIWSVYFAKFLYKNNLFFAKGILGTFPAKASYFGIDIDHILSTKNVKLNNKKYFKIFGSDHNGVETNFSLIYRNKF
jgi:endonuclease/exonuclease/phosphatase (EEP) superfamily protein YafD